MKKALIFGLLIITMISIAVAVEWTTGVYYNVGDQVTYEGKTYECLQAHTSQLGWTPLAVPALWKEITVIPDDGLWHAGVYYNVGDEVKYNSINYIVRQAHTSQADWSPDITPALFLANIPDTYKNALIGKVIDKFGTELEKYTIEDVDSSIKVISYTVTLKDKTTGELKEMTWLDVN